jgi:hypothetical protein
MLNNTSVERELTLRQILSVRCPTCRAQPKEKCTLSTGLPCVKTHLARTQAAAKISRPKNSGRAALRALKAVTNRGFHAIFRRK